VPIAVSTCVGGTGSGSDQRKAAYVCDSRVLERPTAREAAWLAPTLQTTAPLRIQAPKTKDADNAPKSHVLLATNHRPVAESAYKCAPRNQKQAVTLTRPRVPTPAASSNRRPEGGARERLCPWRRSPQDWAYFLLGIIWGCRSMWLTRPLWDRVNSVPNQRALFAEHGPRSSRRMGGWRSTAGLFK